MRPAHRTARTALLASAALLLSACGIPATGVVESGAPATGIKSPTLIYFFRNDALIPVPRKTGRGVDVAMVMRLLIQGPSDQEQRAGVTTAMLPLKGYPKVWNEGANVSILLPPDNRPLSNAALEQLVCTAAHARHTQDPDVGSVQVTITYPSGDSGVWQVGTSTAGCSPDTPADGAARG
jgi:hypothetical protein